MLGKFQYPQLQEPSKDYVYDAQKENNDRNFINAVHHSDVNVRGARWVLFPKKIAANLAQFEELL